MPREIQIQIYGSGEDYDAGFAENDELCKKKNVRVTRQNDS